MPDPLPKGTLVYVPCAFSPGPTEDELSYRVFGSGVSGIAKVSECFDDDGVEITDGASRGRIAGRVVADHGNGGVHVRMPFGSECYVPRGCFDAALAMDVPKPAWSREWPTEPGEYWFFGWRSTYEREWIVPQHHLVKVHNEKVGCQTFAVYSHNNAILQICGVRGLWQPVVLPELPSLEELKEQGQ